MYQPCSALASLKLGIARNLLAVGRWMRNQDLSVRCGIPFWVLGDPPLRVVDGTSALKGLTMHF